jgi:hypothetical protein
VLPHETFKKKFIENKAYVVIIHIRVCMLLLLRVTYPVHREYCVATPINIPYFFISVATLNVMLNLLFSGEIYTSGKVCISYNIIPTYTYDF